MILVFVMYALLASTFTLGKMLLFFLPPLALISLRMVIAGLLLLGMYYTTQHKSVRVTWSDALAMTGLSVIHISIPYVTEFMALQNVAPSCAALMYNLSPFITALFAYIFFNEKMTPRKWLGFVLGFSGIVYFMKPDPTCIMQSSMDNAYALLMISVISSSLGWICVSYLIKHRQLSIMLVNGVAMLLGGMQAFVASGVTETSVFSHYQQLHVSFWLLLGLIIVIANVLFYNLYGYLLRYYTATFLSFVGFVTPLFTALYDWLLLHHQVQTDFFVTIVIVGCGIYLFYQEELKQGYVITKN